MLDMVTHAGRRHGPSLEFLPRRHVQRRRWPVLSTSTHDASSLDLNGPSPVACEVLNGVPKAATPTKYLVQTPAGDILQVWRWMDYKDSLIPVDIPQDYMDEEDKGGIDQEFARLHCFLAQMTPCVYQLGISLG
ncbi:hypothetical protein HU200_027716 [Digitaria exilis]|uniref:Uncharacterized protein n=1 Tax=Digitaria exilis TaxID=1010633 RepID=A0A835C7W4_9POAL|nr:hypothetical protein HU200_027716 [Digitaria exilis]